MASVQRKLVHKQFNSPMGLYSQENVKATLDRELKAFGAEGIEVDENITKPLNLANSAVLRAVEEEEQQIKCGYKRVAWPPASEERVIREFTPQPQTQSPAPGAGGYYPQSQAAAQSTAAAPAQGPIYNNVQPRTPPTQQPQQHYPQPQTNYQNPQNVYGQAPTNNNYASNGYGQTQANYPYQQQQPQQPQQSQQPQQPVQYTQAHFNRKPSREPVVAPTNQYPTQQQQTYEPAPHAVDTAGHGWKPINPPSPKAQREFTAAGYAPSASPAYTGYQQQPTYQQQPQQQQHQQQQYRAPSQDNYQSHGAPSQSAAPQWQQRQNQAPVQQQQWQQPAPQWAQQQQQQQQPPQPSYQTSAYQQQPPQNYPQQNGGSNYAQPQYNSYSQPHSQDQTDQYPHQQMPVAGQDSYRGASPGIITLRKEAPVSQTPAPVYTSQPAAVNYQGGSNLRGDLKWPPPEYKVAAARENEERRLLALGPVCRPRRVNRDYTNFFAKHQLNNAYPSYKVPPGTQHMLS